MRAGNVLRGKKVVWREILWAAGGRRGIDSMALGTPLAAAVEQLDRFAAK
jgi:hypothetical protein